MDITILDRYMFNTSMPIGKGSFSKVYLGTDLANRNKVAIKRMEIGNFSPQMRQRVQEEIDIALKLSHKNIVKTYDVAFVNEDFGPVVYVIMEYCECGDFAKYLVQDRMKETRAKFFFNQLLEGLKYLQEQNIVHRDLKPANLLLTDKNRVLKIADFGFARHLDAGKMSETMCGSPLYMAPEILFGEPYSSKADLWSIGVILYQALYGKHPFQATTHNELMKALKTGSFELPKNVHLSPNCTDLLITLLNKNPSSRLTWEGFFTHPWLRHLQVDKRIDQLRDSMEPRSEPIAIGPSSKSCPISISVSPMSFETLMNGYCSPSSLNMLDDADLQVVQSDIIIPDVRVPSKASNDKTPSSASEESASGRQQIIVRVEKPKDESSYLTYAWSFISSSMKPLSVFRQ